MTSSSPAQAWLYMELAIPKDEWDSSTTVYMLFIHKHTFKLDITSKYPEDANISDPTTWLMVEFKDVLGQYKVELTFQDRDGNPIDYVAGRSLAEIAFLNGTIFTLVSPVNSSIELLLPPENYTIVFYVYGIPVFNTIIEVADNITATYTLENLKHISFPYGEVIGIVEHPGKIESLYLEPMNQIGVLISNSTEPTALRLFPRATWNFTFATVLNALNFTYNPFAKNLLAYTRGNLSAIMMIGAPKEYPVFYFANGSIRGYVYNHEMEELEAWLTNGTFRIHHSKTPFAITINGSALKREVDYSVDEFDTATINTSGGELRVYFKNPTDIDVLVTNSKAKIIVATPYRFSGRYTLKVYENGKLVRSVTDSFTSTVPLTTIEETLDLDPGTYKVEVTVTDEDSKQSLGTASTTYEVEEAPALEEIGWEYYLAIAIATMLAVAAIIAFSRAVAKQVIEEARKRKYVKRK